MAYGHSGSAFLTNVLVAAALKQAEEITKKRGETWTEELESVVKAKRTKSLAPTKRPARGRAGPSKEASLNSTRARRTS